MRVLALLGLFFLSAMVAGGAMAGEEEYMALRGNTPDGKARINAIQGPWRFDRMPPLNNDTGFAAKPGGIAAADTAAGGEYLEWKNHCVFVPPAVAGAKLEQAEAPGFAQVAPYLEQPAPTGERFIEILMEELSSHETPLTRNDFVDLH